MADPAAIRTWFNQIDTDGSGQLTAPELQKALGLGGLQYSIAEAHSFIRAFDQQNNRTLDLNEFMQLHSFLLNVQGAFMHFDRDRSGHLSVQELGQALAQQGFQLAEPALKALVLRHDPDGSGNLSLSEFLRLSLFLRAAMRAFSAFDAGRTGKVELSFNQMVYAGSHLP